MQEDLTVQTIIQILRKLKKTDPLFKTFKKLKTAIDSISIQKISTTPTPKLIVFHFGLGNNLDKQIILQTSPQNLKNKNIIIPGQSYCILQFSNTNESTKYIQTHHKIQQKNYLFFEEVQYQNLKRMLLFMYCKEGFFLEEDIYQIEDCPQYYQQGSIPGLAVVDEFFDGKMEQELFQRIDEGKWEKLSNRRVQHYGFQFKYGENNIHKEQQIDPFPAFFTPILQKLKSHPLLSSTSFDQLTINDYFAGNGIPSHFDTHSPFDLLSGMVMNFKKYNGSEKNVYLKERGLCIFTGEARYAWTHGIACRKMDKIGGVVTHRSRRISLTFRKIRTDPCKCSYYFYCDSQGYDQQTMKKNNPLLAKYLSTAHQSQLSKHTPQQIQQQYVQKAYNAFGFDFHNKVIPQVKTYLNQLNQQSPKIVADLGCGNGEYKNHIDDRHYYIGTQKCRNMVAIQNQIYMDCLKLGFRDGIVDVVLCVAVLHHFSCQQTRLRCLQQISRILTPNGTAIITVMNYQPKKDIYQSPQTILEYCLPTSKLPTKNNNIKQMNLQTQMPRIEERGQVYKRYYHLFSYGQLEELIQKSKMKVVWGDSQGQNIVVRVVKE